MVGALVGAVVGGAGLAGGQIIGQVVGNLILATALTFASNGLTQLGNISFPILPESINEIVQQRHRKLLPDLDAYYSLMRRHGLGKDQADRIWEVSYFYPTPSDLVNWQAKEVFEKELRATYKLDQGNEFIQREAFYKAGLDDLQIDNFWAAHWANPSYSQAVEGVRRDTLAQPSGRQEAMDKGGYDATVRQAQITQLEAFYGLTESAPFFRDMLTQAVYEPLTRVDARRMWDMRSISEADLLRTYLDRGYDIENATYLVTWSKVYSGFPDLMRRYANGWINLEYVREKLAEWGMPDDRAEELVQEKVINLAKPMRVQRERDLTKSEILKGVKKKDGCSPGRTGTR